MTRTTKARQTRIERQVKATMERLYPKVEEKSSREVIIYGTTKSYCRLKDSVLKLKADLEKLCEAQAENFNHLLKNCDEQKLLILGHKFNFYARLLEKQAEEITNAQNIKKD